MSTQLSSRTWPIRSVQVQLGSVAHPKSEAPLRAASGSGSGSGSGNEIGDHFSKWAAHSLTFTPDLLPPPPLGSVAVHHLPVLHKFKVQQFRHLLPQHSHNNIAVGASFSLYNKASWFSSLFFKLASGCYNLHGYQWSNILHDYHCSRCEQHHPFDPLSCLAFCKALDQHVQAYVSSWGPLFSPIVLHWWLSGPSKADRRNLMRTLVPKSLWSCLSQQIPGSTRAKHRAMLDLALEERVKHLDKAVHQANDWLCSNPLPWDPILWAYPSDPLNHFSVSHGAFSTSFHMPPRTRPKYQHSPPLPKHALKKPSKPASAKAQPATHRAQKKPQTPVQPRIRTTLPPPPRQFPALLSTHAHGHHKKAIDHHKPIRSQSFGRPESAPRPLSPSHSHTSRHATVKHAYLSPLGPPLLGAQVRLPPPPPPTPTPPGTSEIFSAHPATFCLLLSTPSALCPFLNPPSPPQGKSAFI